MIAAALWTVAGVSALLGYARAVRRCRHTVRQGKAAARRRAEVAVVFDRAGQRWDADTDRLATALSPLLEETAVIAAASTAGFGDSIVAEERLREAFRSIDPPPSAEEIPW